MAAQRPDEEKPEARELDDEEVDEVSAGWIASPTPAVPREDDAQQLC